MKNINLLIAVAVLTLNSFATAPTYTWGYNTESAGNYGRGASVAVDAANNVYVTGYFAGTVNFDPAGSSTLTSDAGGNPDAFVASYTPTKTLRWKFSIGTPNYDGGNHIVVNVEGASTYIYVTGNFGVGTANFGGTGAVANLTNSTTAFAGSNAFVAKYDAATGARVWAIKIGSSDGGEEGNSIAVDGTGVYVIGRFTTTPDFGGSTLTSSGSNDIFVAKYSLAGALGWAFKLGSGNDDKGTAIAVDGSGNVYVGGRVAYYFSNPTIDFDPSVAGTQNRTIGAGNNDLFIAKYNTSMVYQWVDMLWDNGGGIDDYIGGMAVGASGLYVSGGAKGVDIDPSAGSTIVGSAVSNILIGKYTTAGVFSWGFGLPATTSVDNYGRDLAIDASENVYLTGRIQGTVDFDPSVAGTNTLTSYGQDDIFMTSYSSAGAYIYALNMGTSTGDEGWGIGVNGCGNVYVAGYFSNSSTADFDGAGAAANLTAVGSSDLFVAKYDGCAALPIQLLSFTGNCTPPLSVGEGTGVRINWSTATETNNDYFTIERSSEPGVRSWEKIGTVKGAGNSSSTLNYEFVDLTPNSELPTLYYRLSQTDYDGKTETFNSNQVAVDITECATKVFPNPAGNTLNIPYLAEQDGEIILQVYDVIGKLVKEKVVAAVKGNNKFTLDLTTVAQGMYILKVSDAAGKKNNQKFVRQ